MSSLSATKGMGSDVLVTGATGFVGRRLMAVLGNKAAALSMRSDRSSWTAALQGKQCVVHLAARVHLMRDTAVDPMAEYRKVNVDHTLALARLAHAAGVRRFIFLSSVKVNGEQTEVGKPFGADDIPAPQDDYGISKLEAETGLLAIAKETGLEVVIIRPPLVYGPGVKANFAALMRAVARRWPLPLASVRNHRSLVALDNLVDFIVTCIDHPQAANEIFLVSDGNDLSTPDLIRGLARAQGVAPRIFPFPVKVLQAMAAIVGKRAAVERLCGNLQVDISKARNLLQWTPPVSVEEGLRRAAGDTSHL